jgi:hypothetical protein
MQSTRHLGSHSVQSRPLAAPVSTRDGAVDFAWTAEKISDWHFQCSGSRARRQLVDVALWNRPLEPEAAEQDLCSDALGPLIEIQWPNVWHLLNYCWERNCR